MELFSVPVSGLTDALSILLVSVNIIGLLSVSSCKGLLSSPVGILVSLGNSLASIYGSLLSSVNPSTPSSASLLSSKDSLVLSEGALASMDSSISPKGVLAADTLVSTKGSLSSSAPKAPLYTTPGSIKLAYDIGI